MTLPSLHRFHRWIAIPTGVFIVGWIVTGVVSVVPPPAPPPRRAQTLDLAQIAVTPMEAALALVGPGIAPDVRSIRLVQLGDVLAYEIAAGGLGPRLVDARSGRPITVDAGLARSIAAVRAPVGAQVVHADIVTRRRHDLTYLWGPLPAHRVAFDDPWATVVYVGAEDGSVRSTTRWSRALDTVFAFHTFGPLELVVGEPAVRKGTLVAIALTALVTALTGYAIVVAWRRPGA
jgi:hypothetical protein